MIIKYTETCDKIKQIFDSFLELRPYLTNKETFAAQIIDQYSEGYKILATYENDKL